MTVNLQKDLKQEGEGKFAVFKSRCLSHLLFISKAEAIAEQLCDFNCVILFGLAGATLFVIGSHAAFRELEASDVEELLMEPV